MFLKNQSKNEKNQRQFFLNCISGWLAQGSAAAVGLYLLPLNMHSLGDKIYGISVLAVSLQLLFGYLSFGLGPALIRFFAESLVQQNQTSFRRLISTAQFLLGGIGVVGGLLFLMSTPFFIGYYQIEPELTTDVSLLFAFLAVSFALQLYALVLQGLLLALGRYDLYNGWATLHNIVRLLLVVGFYSFFGATLTTFGLAFLGAAVFYTGGLWMLCFRKIGNDLFFSRHQIDRTLFSPLFLFSREAFLTAFFLGLTIQLPTILTGKTLGPESVADFAPALAVGTLFFALLSQISSPLTPLASRDQLKNQGKELGSLNQDFGQILFILGLLGLLLLEFAGKDLIALWLGSDKISILPMIQLLALGFVFEAVQSVTYHLALGADSLKPFAQSSFYLLLGLLMILVPGLFFLNFSLLDVVLTLTVCRFIRNSAVIPILFAKRFSYPCRNYWNAVYLKPLLFSGLFFLLFGVFRCCRTLFSFLNIAKTTGDIVFHPIKFFSSNNFNQLLHSDFWDGLTQMLTAPFQKTASGHLFSLIEIAFDCFLFSAFFLLFNWFFVLELPMKQKIKSLFFKSKQKD